MPKFKTYITASIRPITTEKDLDVIKKSIAKFKSSFSTNQEDILYFSCVLVSEGLNLNDDYFSHSELIQSYRTPVTKPIDIDHDPNRIVGVILDSALMDQNNNFIDYQNTSSEFFNKQDLMPPLNIGVYCGIWKYLHPEAAEMVYSGVSDQTYHVSMEAFFDDYDYVLGEETVARNDMTIFLDAYLRANGGDGLYTGKKIARSLKNILFGGMGIVMNPANPASKILSVHDKCEPEQDHEKRIKMEMEAIKANIIKSQHKDSTNFKEETVDIEEKNNSINLSEVQKMSVKEEKKEEVIKAEVKQEVKEEKKETVKADLNEDALKALEQNKKDIEDLKKQLEEAKNLLSKATVLAETEKSLRETLENKAKEKESKEKLEYRVATLKKHFNPSDELMQDILVKIKDITDEDFEKTVSFYLSLTASKIAVKEEKKEEPKVEEAKAKEVNEKEIDKLIDELVPSKTEASKKEEVDPKEKFKNMSLEKLLLREEN